MTKAEWLKEITIGLEEQTQTRGIRFGTATELSRVLGYKDQKSFKASFLQNINPVVGKMTPLEIIKEVAPCVCLFGFICLLVFISTLI